MTGIYAQYSENSSFSDNLAANSAQYGILLYQCGNSTLSANTVTNTATYGLYIWYSDNTTVSGNIVSNAVERGINISSADNSTCSDNVISNSGKYGLFLHSSANNLNVTGNSFYGNNPHGNPQGTSQAYDVGTNNNVSYNFWDDWTSPDDNPPTGIVDNPYSIDGSKLNEDTHPLTAPATAHRLSPPVIWHPLEGEILSGIATIQWTTAVDTRDYSVTYNVSYSADAGATWMELATGLTSTSYPWNTSTVSDGRTFLIKVIASGGQGLTQEALSKGTFSIRNAPHTLSSPTLSNPTGGETVNGTITIQWTAAMDSWTEAWGDTVTYSVYYGTVWVIAWGMTAPIPNWIKLASGLTTTSLEWDTTSVADGGNYLIKVVAQCSEGLTAEVHMANTFTIDNVLEEISSEEPFSEEEDADDAPVAIIVIAGATMLLVAGTLLIRRRRRRK
jgi:parallel beta-helix repeat protein